MERSRNNLSKKICYPHDIDCLAFSPLMAAQSPSKNQLYNENSEETLIRCIVDLMDNHEANIPKGEVFSENAYRTG